MPDPVFDATAIQKEFDQYSAGRLKRYDQGLQGVVQWQQKSAKALEEVIAQNHQLKEHADNLQRFTEQHQKVVKAVHEGKLALSAAEERLRPLWLKISSPDARNVVLDAYNKVGHPRTGFEWDWMQAAFDSIETGDYQWEGIFGRLGTQSLKPRARRKEPGGEVGHRRDPLPGGDDSPMPPAAADICNGPALSLRMTFSQTSGLAVCSAFPFTDPPTGRASSMSQTIALIVMGGATDSSALIGTDIQWAAGFSSMSITAELDVSESLFAVTILGGATSSAELILQATLSNGQSVRTTDGLGAAVAPLLWHTSISLTGSRTLSLGGIQLNGAPGSARIFTGVHENTAAVGIVGSSGATAFSAARVKSICVHLR